MASHSLQTNVTPTINKEEDEAYLHAMQLCSSFIVSHILLAANDLDLFEIIAKKAGSDTPCLSASDIASCLSTKNPNATSALKHMLRLLVSHSLLTCSSCTLENGNIEILYGLAPAGKFFVKSVDGFSLATFLRLGIHRSVVEMCYYIKDAVLEGEIPFQKANKMSLFEYMEIDHKFGQEFDMIMSGNSTMIFKRILQTYMGFEGLASLVDVGGGIGTTLNMIISAHPFITGINFDLPRAIEKAPSYKTGIKHVGGDMFVEIPKGDAILMKWILHDWSDEQCLIILKNCYLALPDTGKVIVIDSILPRTPNTSSLAKSLFQFDNLMFAQCGAKERTEQEFEALSKEAGFTNIQIVTFVLGYGVIELYKRSLNFETS